MTRAVQAFRNAMLKADRAPCEALTPEQLSDGHSTDWAENTSQCIDAAASGRSTWKFITLTDRIIQIVGKNAIVRHTLTGETERDGRTNPVKIGALMVWHKPDAQWQLLARRAVRLEEPRTN